MTLILCYVVGTFLSILYVLIEFSHTSSEIGIITVPLVYIRKQGQRGFVTCLRSCGQEVGASVETQAICLHTQALPHWAVLSPCFR